MKNQKNLDWELYDAMDYIACYFGLQGQDLDTDVLELPDWDIFKRHDVQTQSIIIPQLKVYDSTILRRFSYPHIYRWEKEGISPEVNRKNLIGYYPGGE